MTLQQETANLIILDTSVVSRLIQEQADGEELYAEALQGIMTAISFQTVDELWFGALRHNWGAPRRDNLLEHIARHELIESSRELAFICAELRVRQERAGHRLETADAWIAATALLLNCPLATLNGDFDHVEGLRIFSPDLL